MANPRRIHIPAEVTHDNGNKWGGPDSPGTFIHRTISLILNEVPTGGYRIVAFGDDFEDPSGLQEGHIDITKADLQGEICILRNAWEEAVFDDLTSNANFDDIALDVDSRSGDLLKRHNRALLEVSLPNLADKGRELYEFIFRSNSDQGARVIGERLHRALSSKQQVIAIHSEDLFIPWWLLHTSLRTDTFEDLAGGFWGYRHKVVHSFKSSKDYTSCLRPTESSPKVKVGANVDTRLDEEFEYPFVEDVIEYLGSVSDLVVRRRKSDLSLAFTNSSFSDQLAYFGCHARDSHFDAAPGLMLEDGALIRRADFKRWLGEFDGYKQTVYLVNSCGAGQLQGLMFDSFGVELMKQGANALVAPVIDVPPIFAGKYALRFLRSTFEQRLRLGESLHSIARSLLAEQWNPLGLAYGIYRGFDTHFGPISGTCTCGKGIPDPGGS
jgi:hypothetical protein